MRDDTPEIELLYNSKDCLLISGGFSYIILIESYFRAKW